MALGVKKPFFFRCLSPRRPRNKFPGYYHILRESGENGFFHAMRVGYLRKNVNIELYFVTQRKWFYQMCFPAGEQDPIWQ